MFMLISPTLPAMLNVYILTYLLIYHRVHAFYDLSNISTAMYKTFAFQVYMHR